MDKVKLLAQFCEQLRADLVILREAARATAEASTHEESKPENQYDTRALEASYLAGAQSKRIVEVEDVLLSCQQLQVRNFAGGDAIAVSALIEVELEQKRSHFLMLTKGGGLSLNFEGKKINVITTQSPLGEALFGLIAGQTAVVEKGPQTLEYEILSVQ